LIDLNTYGRPLNLTEPVVGRIAWGEEGARGEVADCFLVTEEGISKWQGNFKGLLTTSYVSEYQGFDRPCICSIRQLSHLKNGDVVAIHPSSGLIRTLFRPDSDHNALLLTERCNSFCLMCSQPPIDRDDSELIRINIEAIRLMQPAPASLGLTGGEPTLLGDALFQTFRTLREQLPETDIHMLTNGRRFAWPDYTQRFVAETHPRLTLGIPVYADNAATHDCVVQSRGAFDQTVQGLHQLARYGQPVEIRIVLHALTIPGLRHLADYIYRNLPFAAHVAFMGLEVTGFTRPNLNELWTDPYDYQLELAAAVDYLAIRGMNVSIYNHPLCVLPRSLWKFARRSISDWKNIYLEPCRDCGVRTSCGGFFKSATYRHSVHLHSLGEEDRSETCP
jgi:His-Xaa-Ser system radical SAM maturase HxsC